MIPKLEVTGLSYSYHTPEGETEALTDISFQAAAGEFLAVVGPSGCGKSTLLSLVSGLLTPDSGSVLLDGEPVRRGNTKIGYMLQRDHLFEWRSILKNAALGLEIQNQTDAAHQEKVRRLLSAYGLELFSRSKPSELSGGMRQRAALIRTLALEPDLLLLDEPFSALDYQTRLSVCDDISTIIRSAKKTALLVTHDLSEAVSAADRILAECQRLDLHILTLQDAAYPGRLKNIYDPPCLLYVRGRLPSFDEEAALAVVGRARRAAARINPPMLRCAWLLLLRKAIPPSAGIHASPHQTSA